MTGFSKKKIKKIADPEQRKEGHLSRAPAAACGPSTKMQTDVTASALPPPPPSPGVVGAPRLPAIQHGVEREMGL